MTPRNDLFLLIKTLNKNEKRYFRLFASRHVVGEKNTYLKLFDAILQQKEYDEKQIKEIFKKKQMGKNLAVEKSRLYGLVLKSLSDFHSGISVEAKLRDQMQQIEVLFEKGLFEQAVRLIKKAKKLAKETYKHLYLLELQRWEKRLIAINQYQSDVDNKVNIIYKEAFEWTGRYQKLLHIEQAYYKVLGFHQTESKVRKKKESLKLKQTVEGIQEKIKGDDLDPIQEIYYYGMLSDYYSLSGNFTKSYEYQYKQVALNTRKPADSSELHTYVSRLNNLAIVQSELHKYKEAAETCNKVRQLGALTIAQKSSRVQTTIFISYIIELGMYITIGDFEKGLLVVKSIQKEFEKFKTKLGPSFIFTFWYEFALIYFGVGDYKQSLIWLNKITDHSEQNVRLDLQNFARILKLIVHYELGNELQLPYYVKSVSRYLLKGQRLFKFETLVLEYIRKKMPKINSAKDLKSAFKELKEKMLILKKDKHEKRAFDYFDFISWLESKIEKRPFAEVVKENAKINLS
ncbi:MAG: hypothetical protein ACT4ON_06430 [Bacteroidota bacterium]